MDSERHTRSEADAARAAELVAAARQALDAGQRDRARAAGEEAVDLDPDSAAGHALLAEIYRQDGRLAAALQEMTFAVRLDPDNRDLERGLRELRDEQERTVDPMLRVLKEPPDVRRPRRQRAPRRPRGPARRPWQGWQAPSWLPAVLLIGGIMLVLSLGSVQWAVGQAAFVVGIVITLLMTLFVYRDAQSRGMPKPVVWMWAAIMLVSGLFAGYYGLVALLVYLLITRSPR